MNKTKLFFASIMLALGLTLTFMSPANAAWSDERIAVSCANPDGAAVCLSVHYQRDSDNVGFKLDVVEISGCDYTCSSVNGSGLVCYNQNGTVQFSKTGDAIDLGHADVKLWVPNQTWSAATELTCKYTGTYWVGGVLHYGFTDTVDRT